MEPMWLFFECDNATDREREVAAQVSDIHDSLLSPELASYVYDHFGWMGAARRFPKMKAEEIASMAADGFEVAP